MRIQVNGSEKRKTLAGRLKAGAIANAARDLELAREWFSVDEDAWTQQDEPAPRKE